MAEFDCCECGVHVTAVVSDKPPVPPLCALCLSLPGWHEDYELRTVFGEANGAAWPFP